MTWLELYAFFILPTLIAAGGLLVAYLDGRSSRRHTDAE